MSHFKVLVIGENVEEQLQPYDENLTVEAYEDTEVDLQQELIDGREFYSKNPALVESYGLDLGDGNAVLRAWLGVAESRTIELRIDEDGTPHLWTTANKNRKWDWWSIGGRYSGHFIKKDALSKADTILKGDVDFSAMILRRKSEAEYQWATFQKYFAGVPLPEKSWREFHKDFTNIEDARKAWQATPWIAAAKEAGREGTDFLFMDVEEHFHVRDENPKESFLRAEADFAVAGFYAYVENGEWHSRGDMGWFGVSYNEKFTENEWRTMLKEHILNLPDDTLLTVVDCHI